MDTKKQQMDIMHSLCERELSALQMSMNRYVEESERIKKQLADRNVSTEDGHHGANMFALMAFDRYMTQLTTVIGMARKFNIHLQLNSLDKTSMMDTTDAFDPSSNVGIIGGHSCLMSQTRLVQDYIQWSNGNMGLNYVQDSLNPQAFESNRAIESGDKNAMKLLQEKTIYPASLKFHDIETFLHSILPQKDLLQFTERYTFAASVTHVEDYNKLVFFICEMCDYRKLYEISQTTDVIPIDQSYSLTDTVFGISQTDDSAGESRCVWRAVKLPKELDSSQNLAVLIDFGEIIELSKDYQLYNIPNIFKQHYPMAIKCELKGVCDSNGNIINSHSECIEALKLNEFRIARFYVVKKVSRVLHLLLLNELQSSAIRNNPKSQENIIKICKSNPFRDSFLHKVDSESEEEDNALCVSASAIYTNKSASIETDCLNSINIGDKLQVNVTHIQSPIIFYATQLNTNSEDEINYYWQSEELTPQQRSITVPKINDIILAQYSKDDHWYRAKVIETISGHEQMFKVLYVDFGNTEIVTINELATCTKEMLKKPAQAIAFRIADLQLVSEEKRVERKFEEAKESIAFILIDQTINVEVIDRQGDALVVRFINEELMYITPMLINMGVAERI